MSPGMKKRIRAGQYDFPSSEWKHVSSEAKDLIRSMLQTESIKRPTIDQVMANKWISVRGITGSSETSDRNNLFPVFAQHYTAVPPTPLATGMVLKEEEEAWPEVQEEMNRSLATMRVDYDQIALKSLQTSNNALLNKRRKRTAPEPPCAQAH